MTLLVLMKKMLFGDLKSAHRKFGAFEMTQTAQRTGNWKLNLQKMQLKLHVLHGSDLDLVDNKCHHHFKSKPGLKSHFWPRPDEKS
jgi:hypothetical protein